MTLLKRVFAEKRALAIPLFLVLLANILAYVIVVYPLGVKSVGARDRAITAASAVQTAEADQASAKELVSGKARAEQELAMFYGKVLPSDLAAARRVTYARLPTLARKSSVRYQAGTFDVDPDLRNARLGRLHTRMTLEGSYENIRHFIYDLETSSEFVIVDDVTLAQTETTAPVSATLELSTYYRNRSNGI
jgi:Tfp pilus assembly protein PilO